MKNNLIIGLCLLILITQFFLIYKTTFEAENVNRDGKVNALDLLIVQKKILNEMED